MTHSIVTNSAEQTQDVGEAWGREAQAGWILGLRGDLGAGKTQIVKGFAKALGIKARVQSPTFGLVHEYSGGRLALFHLDLYRLENEEQIRRAGLEEYLYQKSGVTIIEWVDRWPQLSPHEAHSVKGILRYRCVSIVQLSESSRRIEYEDFGA
jgi:tRNA threonylcarbamoyladenosine biosynthesis protein TsaE